MASLLSLVLCLLTVARAADDGIYGRAVALVRQRWLEAAEFDPAAALSEAAEEAEDVVPWLIADTRDGVVHLAHGTDGDFAVVSLGVDAEGRPDAADLAPALARLEGAIRRGPGPIPEGVDLQVALLTGLAHALDRHSSILARARLERFDERIQGRLSGIGASIGLVDGALTVKDVFPDSPAERGGLRRDDRILRIDGVSTVGMSVKQAVSRIRGPEGTTVRLSLARAGEAEPLELVLERARIVIPVVDARLLPGDVGVLAIDHFSDHTARLLADGLAELRAQAPDLKGIVLDLRGNSGGSMIQACRSADLFLQEGMVIRTAGPDGQRVDNLLREYRAHPDGTEPEVPLVVLVDRRSASASEILAGSLALLDRAVLVGERTHGKGTVQKLFTLRPGDDDRRVRFKLTVAQYLVAGDTPIETGHGLDPDLALEPVVFKRGGVEMPGLDREDAEAPDLLWVDERPGWRELSGLTEADRAADPDGRTRPPEDRGDFPLEVARRVALRARGADRASGLAAVEAVLGELEREEDARLQRTFAWRGLDWRPADEPGPAPRVETRVEVVDRPVAGSEVEVRATVRNLGPAPLYRVAVVLSADDRRLPWNGLTLPVGYLPPGGEGAGSAVVAIDDDQPSREDRVDVRVLADRRPPAEGAPTLFRIEGNPPPPVAATVRLVPEDDHDRAEITLEDLGRKLLTEVRLRFALPDDDTVELLDREALIPVLRPGEPQRADIRLRELDEARAPEVELRVDAEVHGRVARMPLRLPPEGEAVRVAEPRLSVEAPLVARPGPVELRVRAEDEDGISELLAWVRGDKIHWSPGDGPRLDARIQAPVEEGTTLVLVEAVDGAGTRTRRFVAIRADEDPADGAAEAP